MNKKGFTLVELLVTVAIVGLVIGFSTFGIIKIVENSKTRAKTLSEKNIMSAARTYSGETDSSNWKRNDTYPYEAYCVTVGELMNKGLLDKNANLTEGITRDSIIIVNRDKITYAIENQEIVKETDESGGYELCTNQVINASDTIEKSPKVTGYQSYTDELRLSFERGKVTNDGNEVPVTYSCAYGEDLASVNLSRQGRVEGNECIISGLKNNKTYVVMVYMSTEKGSIKKADGGLEYSTSDFKDVSVVPKGNTVTITYNDTNVREGNHYFKSTMDATVESNVEKCTLDKNIFKCEGQGTKIEKDTWYRTNSKSIKLTYSTDESIYKEGANKVTVTARITDPSNNYLESNKAFNINKYTITFNKNTAVKIDGKTNSEVKRSCIDTGDGCNITSPSIEAGNGRSVVGWNTNKNASNSTWNVNEEKKITGSTTYYAITKQNVVYIKYSVNGGNIATSSNAGGTWSVSNNIVYRNGSEEITTVDYGSKMRSDGLNNYDNSTNLHISRTGYHGVSGSEWVCLSGCTTSNKTFNQTVAYNASDFCDASSSDCTVTVGVNWEPNVLTVRMRTNGATKNNDGSSVSDPFYTYSLKYNGTAEINFPIDYMPPYGAKLVRDGYEGTGKYHVGSANASLTVNQDMVKAETPVTTIANTLGVLSSLEKGNTTVDLYAGWQQASTQVNSKRFACEGDRRLAVYYVTTCSNGKCNYSSKNGLNSSYSFALDTTGTPSWSGLVESNLVSSVKDGPTVGQCGRELWYVNNSSLNCRTGASTSGTSVTNSWTCGTSIYVYRTTMKINNTHNWFYSSTHDCFLWGEYLSSSKPSCGSSSGGGSSGGTNYCQTIKPSKPYAELVQENGSNSVYCCSTASDAAMLGSSCERVCTTGGGNGSMDCRCMAKYPGNPYIAYMKNQTQCCTTRDEAIANGSYTGGDKYLCPRLDVY